MVEGLSRIVGDTAPHTPASGSYSTTTRSVSRLFMASIHAWVAAATSSLDPAGAGDGHARAKSAESRIKVRHMGRLLAQDCRRYEGHPATEFETNSPMVSVPCLVNSGAAECPLTASAAARRVWSVTAAYLRIIFSVFHPPRAITMGDANPAVTRI